MILKKKKKTLELWKSWYLERYFMQWRNKKWFKFAWSPSSFWLCSFIVHSFMVAILVAVFSSDVEFWEVGGCGLCTRVFFFFFCWRSMHQLSFKKYEKKFHFIVKNTIEKWFSPYYHVDNQIQNENILLRNK